MTRDELVEHVAKLYREKWLVLDNRLASSVVDLVLEAAAERLDHEWPGAASGIVRSMKGTSK
jgi:hypothetical protein